LQFLEAKQELLGVREALLYNSFPLYKDDEGNVVVADAILLSPAHGVVTFALSASAGDLPPEELRRCFDIAEQVPPYVQSRLIKNKQLRRGPTSLCFEITPVTFAPLLRADTKATDLTLLTTTEQLAGFLQALRRRSQPLGIEVFHELIATIEGAKGIIRPKKRALASQDETTKGKQAELVEGAITLFDQQQKHGMMGRVTGPQRIRGLAGSGKTVVLAMKAAQVHLQDPEAHIVYTFWTKSLYQRVKRLITRFYRQFDDRDPDWDHLHILHAWGSKGTPGLYSVACEQHALSPISFQEAMAQTYGDRFDYACTTFMRDRVLEPIYDYVLVDEGQDFPLSFIRMCHSMAKKGRFVLAYDDLQTIFQATTPSAEEIFGKDTEGHAKGAFEEDIVLHKCYRNPREVLVLAHAMGFGLYGRIVQMLENPEHWRDIGYSTPEGEFTAGNAIKIERPKENSLSVISDRSSIAEIVKSSVFADTQTEIKGVADAIKSDIADGLQPEDILVVCVDDRQAKRYLSEIEIALHHRGVSSNNLHTDTFGIRDFIKDGRITLSTVHKAKGNEAFMVYVVGVDAVMFNPNVRSRNMLFTAMTRAKGWVRVSGVGKRAERCKTEMETAAANFPYLVFKYPEPPELKIMKRDLAEAADKRLKARRLIEQLEDFSDSEIQVMLAESKGRRRGKPRYRYARGSP
jgi:superfamily I DNA and RNA helicase